MCCKYLRVRVDTRMFLLHGATWNSSLHISANTLQAFLPVSYPKIRFLFHTRACLHKSPCAQLIGVNVVTGKRNCRHKGFTPAVFIKAALHRETSDLGSYFTMWGELSHHVARMRQSKARQGPCFILHLKLASLSLLHTFFFTSKIRGK